MCLVGGQVRTAWPRPCPGHGPRPTPRGRRHLGTVSARVPAAGTAPTSSGWLSTWPSGPVMPSSSSRFCSYGNQLGATFPPRPPGPAPQPGCAGHPPGQHWLRLLLGPQHHHHGELRAGGTGLGEGKGLAQGHRAPGVGSEMTPQACLPSWVCTGGSVLAGWADPPSRIGGPPEPPRYPDAPAPAPEGPPKA